MDIKKALLKEHSKAQANKIQCYVSDDPLRFAELVSLFLNGPYRVTQRASWPLSMCVEHHPALIKPHLSALLKNLKKPGLHDAVKRNTMRLLQFIQVPKKFHGITADVCFGYLLDVKEPIAVRVFAMTVLANIASEMPDLQKELILVLEDQLPYGSAGFVARARKTLKQIEKLKNES